MLKKFLIVFILAALPIPGFALTKCLVNGKTIYQKNVCRTGTQRPINTTHLSIMPVVPVNSQQGH